MKKTIILASVAIATLFAFSSCQKDELEKTSVSGVRIITAEFENNGTFGSANICVAKSSTEDGSNKENLVFRNATAANSIAGPVTASFEGTALSLTTSSLDKKYVSAVGTSAPSGNVFYLATAPVTTGSATVNCYKTDKKGSESKGSKELAKNTIYSMDLSSMAINNTDLTGQHGILNNHEYVVVKCSEKNIKWATKNIGATALTGTDSYGDLFSWGDVQTKENYGSSYYTAPAANIPSDITPDSGYDVARVKWGGTWRMPTGNEGEFKALKEATYWKWEDSGYYVYVPQTGDAGKINDESSNTYNKSDALLFFPAAGYSYSVSRSYGGSDCYCWSSTCFVEGWAYGLSFSSSLVFLQGARDRFLGESVRPVSD